MAARPVLTVRLTRISPTHHRFEYLRGDATGERIVLETKSCLFHDLLHFAVETEAKLGNSFYGLLARTRSYNDLSMHADQHGEIAITERIVGPLNGILKDSFSPRPFLAAIRGFFEACGDEAPAWLTEDLLVAVKERMRRLNGQWIATRFGESMELRFEVNGN